MNFVSRIPLSKVHSVLRNIPVLSTSPLISDVNFNTQLSQYYGNALPFLLFAAAISAAPITPVALRSSIKLPAVAT